jgi:hypothetical protein
MTGNSPVAVFTGFFQAGESFKDPVVSQLARLTHPMNHEDVNVIRLQAPKASFDGSDDGRDGVMVAEMEFGGDIDFISPDLATKATNLALGISSLVGMR